MFESIYLTLTVHFASFDWSFLRPESPAVDLSLKSCNFASFTATSSYQLPIKVFDENFEPPLNCCGVGCIDDSNYPFIKMSVFTPYSVISSRKSAVIGKSRPPWLRGGYNTLCTQYILFCVANFKKYMLYTHRVGALTYSLLLRVYYTHSIEREYVGGYTIICTVYRGMLPLILP